MVMAGLHRNTLLNLNHIKLSVVVVDKKKKKLIKPSLINWGWLSESYYANDQTSNIFNNFILFLTTTSCVN